MDTTQVNLNGKLVKHKRTNVVRKIFVLDENETPSAVANKGKFDSIRDILLDTYLVNKQFYEII